MYEARSDQRDKFEVFAVHDKEIQSFADLDTKLTNIKNHYWQGKELPFPVLLDATGKTEELFGINAHPTGLLIDPEGKLVGESSVSLLESKLPRLPVGKYWERHRDLQKNVHWTFQPSRDTLTTLAQVLTRFSNCRVELDTNAVQSCGLTPDGPLPGVVIGIPITLRTIEELLLAPHGLGIVPSADEKQLLITNRPTKVEAPSHLQKLRAKDLTSRLIRRADATFQTDARPLEIMDQPLLEVMRRISDEFDLPVALDAKAMHRKTLDETAKVSGNIDPNNLHHSLTKMFEPLGLVVEVRHEVLLVTPRRQ